MQTLYEIKNVTSNQILFARDDLLEVLKIAIDISTLDGDHYEVLKNGLRFATTFKGELDIIYPRKTFKED